MIKDFSKNFKFFVLLMLGFAMVFMIGVHLKPANATTNAAETADLAKYTHVPTVATIDRRQVVRGPEGASIITWSTDANGAKWVDSINLTTKN